MLTKKSITIPIYDHMVHVVVCDNQEEFEQAVFDAGWEEDTSGNDMVVLNYPDAPGNSAVIINMEAFSYGNIAHESLHLTGDIWKRIGAQWDVDNDEPMCYLQGFIVDCLIAITTEHKKNKRGSKSKS